MSTRERLNAARQQSDDCSKQTVGSHSLEAADEERDRQDSNVVIVCSPSSSPSRTLRMRGVQAAHAERDAVQDPLGGQPTQSPLEGSPRVTVVGRSSASFEPVQPRSSDEVSPGVSPRRVTFSSNPLQQGQRLLDLNCDDSDGSMTDVSNDSGNELSSPLHVPDQSLPTAVANFDAAVTHHVQSASSKHSLTESEGDPLHEDTR